MNERKQGPSPTQPPLAEKPHWLLEHALKVIVGAIIIGVLGWIGANY